MSNFFNNRIDTAHALIDEHDYDTPVEIVQNLKTRIHKEDVLQKIEKHDEQVEKEFNTQFNSLCQLASDPFEQHKRVAILKKWRAQEYVKFYDKIAKDHDL